MRWKKPGNRPRPVTKGPHAGSIGFCDGPLSGRSIITHNGDGATLRFNYMGQTGRYIKEHWRPDDV